MVGRTGGSLAEIVGRESVETEPLIVELDGRPIAYIQSYDPHLEDGHPYQDQPFGTLGMDISIGPPISSARDTALRSSGSSWTCCSRKALRALSSIRIRAIFDLRAYEKAGFNAFDRRTTIYGPALMMARPE